MRGHLQSPTLARLTDTLRAADIGYALIAMGRNSCR